jgi:DMSO/TMAO reductase YedYZ molybdopterin-dependent catalytic subunit
VAKKERLITELYQDDPERADALIFGRKTDVSRRGFLNGAGLTGMSAAVGGTIVFGASMPAGLIPAALAQEAKKEAATTSPAPPAAPAAPKGPQFLQFPGKDGGLVLLGDKPLVAETPEHLLDDETTPTSKFFIRNNGQIPEATKEPDKWKLVIDGEVNQKLEITLGELKAKFKPITRRLVLECGGNGRSFFTPQARGNQWTNGGVGCAEWTGVKVSDVVKAAGLKPSAVFSGHYSADPHLSGDTKKDALSRGVPIKKLMDENNLILWAMNGKPLEQVHGFPVRLLIPGWPGSVSQKWLTRIWVRDKEHDGQGMGSTSYRVAIKPIVPGGKADPANFKDLESMPVRSIITNPENGRKLATGTKELKLRGAAWAGDYTVKAVDVSLDFGATWQKADVTQPKNRYDWQRWVATIKLPSDGYYEVWTRATDSRGVQQPHIAGGWNPQGYGANPMHRVAVLVG